MLGLILFLIVFYGLCMAYVRLQMYFWYGPDSTQADQSGKDSPLVIEIEPETHRQNGTASARRRNAGQGA